MLFTQGPQQIRSKQVTVDQVVVISAKAGGATTLFFFFFFWWRRGGPCWLTGCGIPGQQGTGAGQRQSSRAARPSSSHQRGALRPARAGGGQGCYSCCPQRVPPDSETHYTRLQLPPGVRGMLPAEMDHSTGEPDK